MSDTVKASQEIIKKKSTDETFGMNNDHININTILDLVLLYHNRNFNFLSQKNYIINCKDK
jgi:hypothetical protein